MAELTRSLDWDATSLGPLHAWPQSLITVVRILLTSRYAMWMGWGPELNFLYNDAYRPTLGVKHPWALGKPAREVWAEIWPDVGPRIDTVLSTGVATWDEGLLLFLERSGYPEETYHTFSYSPLTDDGGAVAGMLCVVTEETDRVIGERRLASLRELASELASTTDEPGVLASIERSLARNDKDLPFTLIYLFDAERTHAKLACRTGIDSGHPAAAAVIDVNDPEPVWPAGTLLDGSEPVIVADLATRFPGLPAGAWDKPPARACIVPIAQRGQLHPVGFIVAALNPYRQYDAAYAGFIDLVAGQIASSLANARAYEEETRRAEALAELDRSKTEFFSNVSHEFRTPLTLMLGPVEEALASEAATPNRQRLEVIQRNARRLLRLVNSLLDFSRVQAGRTQALYVPTDLSEYTRDLASTFRSAIESAGLRLLLSFDTLDEPVYVDRDMWEKIVLNLVSNAFKHTFDGDISVSMRQQDGRAVLEVRDTGVGIAPDQLERVFERFHRVPNARSRTHEGTGIGLALVQDLVRLHGGTIDVVSDGASGTTFTVSVPLGFDHLPSTALAAIRETAEPLAVRASPYVEEARRWVPGVLVSQPTHQHPAIAPEYGDGGSPEAHAATTVGKQRILLADDNADMRDYVARLLRDTGYEVEAVADGEAALRSVQRHPPDLVLTDAMMPVIDGFSLLRQLRNADATRDLPLIILSARAGEEARIEGIGAGANDYVVKPFSANELLARVDAQLTLARHRRDADAELRESEARFRNMADHAPVMLWVTEPDGNASFLNRHWYEFTGQTPANALGFGWLDAVHPEDRAQTEAAFVLANARQEPFRSEYRLRRADGEYVRCIDSAAPRFDSNGQLLGYIGSVTDIEAHARLLDGEQDARRLAEDLRREAETANRSKSEFLAAMSHELRTPLNAIAGYVELMQMGIFGPTTEGQQQTLSRVERSGRHLLSLINDVLNFARIEAGRLELDIRDVDLAEAVTDIAAIMEPQFAAKQISYSARVPENVIVRADRDKLQQILLNLLSNALKFTPAGGSVTVDLGEREGAAPGFAFARVTDTGIGIPRDRQQSIFDPFVQVHRSLTNTVEGTGLGLSISRDLAHALGGELRVRSVPGAGATFTLSVPKASAG